MMSESNSEKYNECNPRTDSYCIFEKQSKELQLENKELKEACKGWDNLVSQITSENFAYKQKLEKIKEEQQLLKDGFSVFEGYCVDENGLRTLLENLFEELLKESQSFSNGSKK